MTVLGLIFGLNTSVLKLGISKFHLGFLRSTLSKILDCCFEKNIDGISKHYILNTGKIMLNADLLKIYIIFILKITRSPSL